MKNFFKFWFWSSFAYYLFFAFLYFHIDVEMFPRMSALNFFALFLLSVAYITSAIVYHPYNKKYYEINKGMFLLEFTFRYAVFVSAVFAKFYGVMIPLYIILPLTFIVESYTKFKIKRCVNIWGSEYFVTDGKTFPDGEVVQKSSFRDRLTRNITLIATLNVFAVLAVLVIFNVVLMPKWLLVFIGFVVMPLLWLIAEIIDVGLWHKQHKD